MQIAGFFGHKVEEYLQGRDAAFDGGGAAAGLALLVDKGINILQRHLPPGFAAGRDELAEITHVQHGGPAAGRPPFQILGELG